LAVAYKSHADNGTHVSKRKQRNKDVEIVFDPDSHRCEVVWDDMRWSRVYVTCMCLCVGNS
jgi:hypothetical protein